MQPEAVTFIAVIDASCRRKPRCPEAVHAYVRKTLVTGRCTSNSYVLHVVFADRNQMNVSPENLRYSDWPTQLGRQPLRHICGDPIACEPVAAVLTARSAHHHAAQLQPEPLPRSRMNAVPVHSEGMCQSTSVVALPDWDDPGTVVPWCSPNKLLNCMSLPFG